VANRRDGCRSVATMTGGCPTQAELITLANHKQQPRDRPACPSPSKPQKVPPLIGGQTSRRVQDKAWVVNRGRRHWGQAENRKPSVPAARNPTTRVIVRGEKRGEQHHYRDNTDGTVTDADSGLMWAQTPGPETTWDSAGTYAKGLATGGHNDWRLPDVKELASLIDFRILNSVESTGVVSLY